MILVRPAAERGTFDHGWLKTAHTFSFGDYRDPDRMGFRSLRVINDDVVDPGRGFAEHPHRDMEIITYPLAGALLHRDSLGHEEVIRPGMVQRMSAGSGIRHAELNASRTDPVHLLQIWIRPDATGHDPRHETRAFPVHEQPGRFHLVASPDGREGSLTINQDARMLAGALDAGSQASVEIAPGRGAWVHIAKGRAHVNGVELGPGDGAAVTDETTLTFTTDEGAEALVFDLA